MSFSTIMTIAPEQVIGTTSNQRHPLGARAISDDGTKVYRYAKNGAVALASYLVCVAAAETPYTTATDIVFSSTYAAGTTHVGISDNGITDTNYGADSDFKGGYLIVASTDTAYAQAVKILGHTALNTSTGTGSILGYLDLERPGLVKGVATSTSMVKLVRNPYSGVIVFAGANQTRLLANARPAGVAQCAVPASYYCWLQTWGLSLVRAGGGGADAAGDLAGVEARLSTGDTGAYCAPSTWAHTDTTTGDGYQEYLPKLGVIVTAAPAANFYSLIDLQIAP